MSLPQRIKIKETLILFWKPILTIFFWGNSFIATKYALEQLDPLTIIFLRLVIASILLAVMAFKLNKSFSLNKKEFGGIFILALIAIVHLWVQVEGLNHTSAANTGWIIGFSPIFMAIIGFFILREKITSIQLLGIFLAFGGLLLLVSKGDLSSVNLISNKGDFLVLGSALTWAAYSFVNKKIALHYSPTLTVMFLFIMMAIIISPVVINKQNFISVLNLNLVSWISILFLGIFCSGAAYVLWSQALSEMPSYKLGAFLYIQPFITLFSAWLLLGEEITIVTIISGLVIIGGVILVNRK
jgi:drug/metabolite transporter (DMT)-like permease